MNRLLQDVRYAARGLIKTPLFSLGVILTLALGIGINATMFGVVDVLFLRPPAGVVAPERIVRINFRQDYGSMGVFTQPSINFPTYLDLRDNVKSFEQVAAITSQSMGLGRGTDAVQVNGSAVSYQYFAMLGVQPAIGRFFTAEEDRTGGDRVVVLSYGFWQRQYNGDRSILGRALPIGKGTYTVIGVGPEHFAGIDTRATDLFLPIHPAAEGDVNSPEAISSRNYIWLSAIARLKPDVLPATAAAEATVAFRRGASQGTRKDSTTIAVLGPIQEARAPEASSDGTVGLWIGVVAAIVLLIACANVANLLLARANARRRELAVRSSLGAGRAGLIRALLAESLVLAAAGGAGAVVLALWTGATARHFLLPQLAADVPLVEGRMLSFTCAIVLLTTVLTGLVPAWQASRTDLVGALKTGGHGSTAGGGLTRTVLLVAQIALTLVLLVGAGLFVRSLRNVQAIDLGFDADRVFSVSMNLSGAGISREDANTTYLRLRDEFVRMPGVESAAASMGTPFSFSWAESLRAQGVDSLPHVKGGGPYVQAVTPGYLTTMGTRLKQGRDFTDGDRERTAPVVIVGSTFARLVWPDQDPVGKCVYRGEDTTTTCTTVVGVAMDAKRGRVTQGDALLYYVPIAQYEKPTINGIFVRSRTGIRGLAASLQREVRAFGNLPYAKVESLQDQVTPQMRSWQLGASAFTAFGLLALVIAATGVFAVLSYTVSQRTKEIGVRVALGAQAHDVVRLVVGQGVRAAIIGAALGGVLAFFLGRAIASLLYKVPPADPKVFGMAACILVAVAIGAAYLPARRASRLAPMIALRSE